MSDPQRYMIWDSHEKKFMPLEYGQDKTKKDALPSLEESNAKAQRIAQQQATAPAQVRTVAKQPDPLDLDAIRAQYAAMNAAPVAVAPTMQREPMMAQPLPMVAAQPTPQELEAQRQDQLRQYLAMQGQR